MRATGSPRHALTVAAALTFVLATACGSPQPGGTTQNQVNGTVGGKSFAVGDAIYTNGKVDTGQATLVGLTTWTSACTQATQNNTPPQNQVLIFELVNYNSTTRTTSALTGPGQVPIYTAGATNAGPLGIAEVAQTGTPVDAGPSAGCETTVIAATGGSITVTSLSAGAITGTFDLTFASGDHLTGSFNAPACAALGTSTGAPPTCH
jgi:hypothetical protein